MADSTAEVVVIGAGVIGLACAFRVAREGRQVLLLDRDVPGMGASFGNAGHIATEQVFPLASPAVVRGALGYLLDRESPLRIRPGYLLSILPWLVRFGWAARRKSFNHGVAALAALQSTASEDFSALLESASASALLHMDGHLVIVEKKSSVTAAQKEISTLAKYGVQLDWIVPAEVREMAPEITADVEGALRFTGTGHVDDPQSVCEALFKGFLEAGGTFAKTQVIRAESRGNGFSISTADGRNHAADRLLLSCGAWSKDLASQLGYTVPLDTERGYHITLPDCASRFPVPIASWERKVIMTPMTCGLRMTGTVEFGGLSAPPDPHRFELLKHHLHALAAGIATDDATTWMGFRPSLPDHLPVLGRVPDGRHLYFAFGHQHLGLTLAGVTARIIAAQMRGEHPGLDMTPYSPDRF